jgi:uncharacterized membrane protein
MFENYDKTVSVLSYIPVLGWLIALIMNSDKSPAEKSYNAFHLRQGLGLSIVSFIYSVLNEIVLWLPYIGNLADKIIIFSFIGIAIMGILNAVRGERKYLPIFGQRVEALLGEAFE